MRTSRELAQSLRQLADKLDASAPFKTPDVRLSFFVHAFDGYTPELLREAMSVLPGTPDVDRSVAMIRGAHCGIPVDFFCDHDMLCNEQPQITRFTLKPEFAAMFSEREAVNA